MVSPTDGKRNSRARRVEKDRDAGSQVGTPAKALQ